MKKIFQRYNKKKQNKINYNKYKLKEINEIILMPILKQCTNILKIKLSSFILSST